MSTRSTTSQPSAPTETRLREAALRHLARYAATQARLLRVLDRRIDRWLTAARRTQPEDDTLAPQAAASRQAARRVVAALAASQIIDDAAYAQTRARMLGRTGRSHARIAQHLAQRGIAPDIARAALPPDAGRQRAAALLLVRKRRLGPYAPPETQDDPAAHRRALGILARAGFAHDTAHDALRTSIEEAEEQIERLRRS